MFLRLRRWTEMTGESVNPISVLNGDKYECINGTETLTCKCPTTISVPDLPDLPPFESRNSKDFPVIAIILPVIVILLLFAMIPLWRQRRRIVKSTDSFEVRFLRIN